MLSSSSEGRVAAAAALAAAIALRFFAVGLAFFPSLFLFTSTGFSSPSSTTDGRVLGSTCNSIHKEDWGQRPNEFNPP